MGPDRAASSRVSRSLKPIWARRACSSAKRAAIQRPAWRRMSPRASGSAASCPGKAAMAPKAGCCGGGSPFQIAAMPAGVSLSHTAASSFRSGLTAVGSDDHCSSTLSQRSRLALLSFCALKRLLACPSSNSFRNSPPHCAQGSALSLASTRCLSCSAAASASFGSTLGASSCACGNRFFSAASNFSGETHQPFTSRAVSSSSGYM